MTYPTLSGYPAGQKECEIVALIALMNERKVRSYLEIGARHGDTFHRVCAQVRSIEIAYAIDLPGGPWGQDGTDRHLANAVSAVAESGVEAMLFLGDSQSDEMVRSVVDARLASKYRHPFPTRPFDVILIDGDHRYEGVKKDFEQWSPFVEKLIAFHDIDGVNVIQKTQRLPVEVPVLWSELKPHYPHFEFIEENPKRIRPMGIGVLDMEAARAV